MSELVEQLFQGDQGDYPDRFVEGFYLFERSGCVGLPVRVWFGPPLDLESGGEMDRAPRWQFQISGVLLLDERVERDLVPAPLEAIWPGVAGSRIEESEYLYRLARIEHARTYRPDDPFADKRGRVDWMTADVFD